MSDLLRASEENGHRLQTLESDLSKVRTDQEQRLSTLEQRMSEAATAAAAPQTTEPAAEPKPAATKPATSRKTTTTVKPEGGPAPAVSTADATPAGDAGEDAYSQGFHLWEAGQYDE